MFRGLRNAHQNGLTVAFEVSILDTRACMPEFQESNYIMHPATLDTVFQAMMVSVPRLSTVEKQVWVPTGAASLFISSGIDRTYGSALDGLVESSISGVREMMASVLVRDRKSPDSLPAIIIEDFKFTGLGSTQEASDTVTSKLYAVPVWKPDLDLVDGRMLRRLSRNVDDGGIARFCSMTDSLISQMCQCAIPKLEPNLNASLPAHLLKYAAWMRKRSASQETGLTTPPESVKTDETASSSSEMPDIDRFIEEFPVDGKLTLHVYQSLEAIFAQEITPIATLRQDNMLDKAYQEVYGLQINVELMKTWFTLKAHKLPMLRVVEIGAGTASSTLPMLQALSQDGNDSPLFSSWTFTDISAGWFENAKTVLGNWSGRVEYKVLDIDRDPLEQGFEASSYDVVLAVNVRTLKPISEVIVAKLINISQVLHATKNIHKSLQHCNTLLKAGGNLTLGEYTNPNELGNFVFGIMPGWWASEDGREDGPLLQPEQWHTSLLEAGFSGADLSLTDNDDPITHRMSTIVSTKLLTCPHQDVVIVIPTGQNEVIKTLAADISRQLQLLGHKTVVKDLSAAGVEASGKSVISLLDYDAPFFDGVTKETFELVKGLLLHSKDTLWVTRSDPEELPGHPSKRMISGVMRCVKMEDSSRFLHELHLSRLLTDDLEATGNAICKRLCTIWDAAEEVDSIEEMETEEREGYFHIPRHMPYKSMNDSLAFATKQTAVTAQSSKLLQTDRPLKLTIGHPGMLDTLHFVDDEEALQPLGEYDVEVTVKACALNFL